MSYPYNSGAAELYYRAVCREIELYGAELPAAAKRADSLFIGGGTPTCLDRSMLLGLIAGIAYAFELLPSSEVTLEANPGTVSRVGLAALRAGGVNRLSLGIQAFQDHLLTLLGRIHTAEEGVEAVRTAVAAGYRNLNLDLIYGIPTQTMADWQASLEQAIRLNPTHLAVYGLQLEPGTPLAKAVTMGELPACPEELDLEMYRLAIAYLTANGYDHYEISNFARPGYQSKHNLKYWLNQPYLGFGPAAHSSYNRERWENYAILEQYAEKLTAGEKPVQTRESIVPAIEMTETMIMGLRLRQGVDLEDFHLRFGQRAEEVYTKEIAALEKAGLLEIAKGHLRLTDEGLPVGNVVFKEFV